MEKIKSGIPLLGRSAIQFFAALFGLGGLIFITAGSLRFANGWLYLGAFFIPDLLLILYLYVKDPQLLEKRLNREEKVPIQKLFNALYYLIALAVIISSGLNYRFRWSVLPFRVVLTAAVIMILGFSISAVAMSQNRYASRTVELQNGQKVIDTGMYSLIRHPMYLSALLFFCPMPLVLGSLLSFVPAVIAIPVLLVMRILNEEKLLSRELPGYNEYMKKVRYRLIPFIW